MARSRKPSVEEAQKPLLLRRRADGTLALDGKAFPPVFDFGIEWLFENSAHARKDGDQIVLELANATARYDIVERIPHGFRATLASEKKG